MSHVYKYPKKLIYDASKIRPEDVEKLAKSRDLEVVGIQWEESRAPKRKARGAADAKAAAGGGV